MRNAKLVSAVTMYLLGFVASVPSRAQSLPLLTHHVRNVTVSGTARPVGRLPVTQSMRLVLVLPLRNQAELDDLLSQLYDPASSSYRHFLTVEEFTDRFGPSQDDYDAVTHFAEANGFTVVGTSRNRLNLDVTATAANIESAFHLTMRVYQHPTENRTFYAPDREPTPDLQVQLWRIAGLDNYSIPKPALVHKNADEAPLATIGSGPSASFLGSDMRAAYYGGPLSGSGQSLGLLEYLGTDLADLNTYYKNIGQTNKVPIKLVSTDGASTNCFASQGCDDTEQTIDMTQALGMAPGLSSLVMYVGFSDAAIFNAMATAKPLNAQLSSSWTWAPADPGTDEPYFKEFAAQGQNLFQAAGDLGAWIPSSEIYPADDPYVTSVGGTDLQTSSAGGPWSSETAWVDGGGGISPNQFPIPSWQMPVTKYCTDCSQTYRNGPDVSANANLTFYVCADQTTCTANYYGGTSFAAPMWAGYMALANEQSAAFTGGTVGFLNPSIYGIGLGSGIPYEADFHDILSGSNGYPAEIAYDLATGWGSPSGSGIINVLAPGFSISAFPDPPVQEGFDTHWTVSVESFGKFNGTVELSCSPGCSLNPTSITGSGTSQVTVSADGNGTVVTGTSGSVVHSVILQYVPSGPPHKCPPGVPCLPEP